MMLFFPNEGTLKKSKLEVCQEVGSRRGELGGRRGFLTGNIDDKVIPDVMNDF